MLLSKCPQKAKAVRTALDAPIKKAKAISVNEALALLLDQRFTKEQYCAIKDQCKKKECDIYPKYKMVIKTSVALMISS